MCDKPAVNCDEIAVICNGKENIPIESIDVAVERHTRIPEGITDLNTPTRAEITYICEGKRHTAEISVSYDMKEYAPKKGWYILSVGTVQQPFVLPETVAKNAEINVEVAEIDHKKCEDTFFFRNAAVKVAAKARGEYIITDVAGLHTYYENVNVIRAMEISGETPSLIIESPLVYVNKAITFTDIYGVANVDVAKSLVTMIRTNCADQVRVNGIILSDFNHKNVTEFASSGAVDASKLGTFFFNGIPGIIARGEDGGTYAYRSYDMQKLSATNLAGWDVSGGSCGYDTVTEVTNVRFVSGTVHRLFGAGQGTTLDAAMILDGGAAGHSTYGGAMEAGTVLKATIVYEYGDSKRRAYIGGIDGSVMGEPNRAYGAEEYAAEVWWFDFSVQYCQLGGLNGGNIYGNIRFKQYGGKHLYLLAGGKNEGTEATLYGDVDITVYGGLWEKTFVQTASHHGNAHLKLRRGIGWGQYPIFQKENSEEYITEVEWFGEPEPMEVAEYIDNRNQVIDVSEDAGKLIVRFLETKLSDESDKGKLKIRDGTGDCIYISFPDGQNMLIDTGTKDGAPFIIQDLKDMGVVKLDYLMITHQHADHMGAIEEICEAFEVDMFLFHKYTEMAQRLMDAVEMKKANVKYIGMGDKLNFGEVQFDIINPVEEVVQLYSDINNKSIAFVMTYEDSKTFLGADALAESEDAWLANEKIKELISNCQLVKLNHHAICNANTIELLSVLNANKYVITQMRDNGCQAAQTIASLQGAFGVSLEDVYMTGSHGLIKAVLEKSGNVDMCYQYTLK